MLLRAGLLLLDRALLLHALCAGLLRHACPGQLDGVRLGDLQAIHRLAQIRVRRQRIYLRRRLANGQRHKPKLLDQHLARPGEVAAVHHA